MPLALSSHNNWVQVKGNVWTMDIFIFAASLCSFTWTTLQKKKCDIGIPSTRSLSCLSWTLNLQSLDLSYNLSRSISSFRIENFNVFPFSVQILVYSDWKEGREEKMEKGREENRQIAVSSTGELEILFCENSMHLIERYDKWKSILISIWLEKGCLIAFGL